MGARVYPIPKWKKERIVKMRRDGRMSQPDIAKATNIHITTVSAILRRAGLGGRLKDE